MRIADGRDWTLSRSGESSERHRRRESGSAMYAVDEASGERGSRGKVQRSRARYRSLWHQVRNVSLLVGSATRGKAAAPLPEERRLVCTDAWVGKEQRWQMGPCASQ